MSQLIRAGLIILVVFSAGCTDRSHDPVGVVQGPEAEAIQASEPIPPRPLDRAPWGRMLTQELWERVAAADSTVVVGLKEPGMARGIWKDVRLIDQSRVSGIRRTIEAVPGISVLHEDTLLPVLTLKLGSLGHLAMLRARPETDYIEPAKGRMFVGSSGCSWEHVDPSTYWKYPTNSLGDRYHYRWGYGAGMHFRNAWNRASGQGVVIGVTDTGLAPNQEELTTHFASGASGNRWVHHTSTYPYGGSCSHGTRVAGTITAPNNGQGVVGAAWGASLVNVRVSDWIYETTNNTTSAEVQALWLGIRVAATYTPSGAQTGSVPGRIVNMSWGSDFYWSVYDEIAYWYARERLFFGASGSLDWPWADVVFPAKLSEVVAVSAVTSAGGDAGNIRYGPSVEVSAIVDQLGTGESTHDISELGLTSGATATMSGIAALLWSTNLNQSRNQVRQKLKEAGHLYPGRNDIAGYGIVDAARALGAIYGVWAAEYITSGGGYAEPATYQISAGPRGGDGPFSYYWDPWGCTTPTVYHTMNPGDPALNYTVWVTDQTDGSMEWKSGTLPSPPGGCDPQFIC